MTIILDGFLKASTTCDTGGWGESINTAQDKGVFIGGS